MSCNCGNGTCGGCQPKIPQSQAGAAGKNAYTVLAASFTQPAVSANVTITVSTAGQFTNAWAVPGQTIFIQGGGDYEVVAKVGINQITVKNIGSAVNVAPGVTVPSNGGVSPAGKPGTNGTNGATGATGPQGPPGDNIPGGLIVASLVFPAAPIGVDDGIELTMPFSLMGGGNGKTLEIDIYSGLMTSPASIEIVEVSTGTIKTAAIPMPGSDTQYQITIKITMVKTSSTAMSGFISIWNRGVNDDLTNYTGTALSWTSIVFGNADEVYRFIFTGGNGNASGIVKYFNPIV